MKASPLIIFFPVYALLVGIILLTTWYLDRLTIEESALDVARLKGDAILELFHTVREWNDERGLYLLSPKTNSEQTGQPPALINATSIGDNSLTQVNSAHLTRELGELYTAKGSEVIFSSLELMNPDNAPDSWTRHQLKMFESSPRVVVEQFKDQYRYLAPLPVVKECLQCHQGYKVGDIRGGLGFIFPKQKIDDVIAPQHERNNIEHTLAFIVFTLLLVLGHTVYQLFQKRVFTLTIEKEELSEQVSVDTLTGALSRKALDIQLQTEFSRSKRHHVPLTIIMCDLDHFKRINDNYGHLAGDEVLQTVTTLLLHNCVILTISGAMVEKNL